VQQPAIKAVGFTGSLGGGRALFDLCCARPDPIPFYGELGSMNPFVITPAAARARGAQIGKDWVGSLTLGAGQFCVKPALLLVPREQAEAVVAAAVAACETVPAQPLLNASIHRKFGEGTQLLAAQATPLSGGSDSPEGFYVRPVLVRTSVSTALAREGLLEEVFGPAGVILDYDSQDELAELAARLGGSLTMTIHGEDDDPDAPALVSLATTLAGRVVWNGYPTGVAVSDSQQHGGPWPSSTSARDTSVGAAAISRFLRGVCYQNFPAALLPPELRG
jgi:NADP-dependent aldehyde dehydrogenase